MKSRRISFTSKYGAVEEERHRGLAPSPMIGTLSDLRPPVAGSPPPSLSDLQLSKASSRLREAVGPRPRMRT
uniref:Uncharacterized protein n=2 Tax=Oryza TaxID=4527 RepID=A0A0E0PA30_ORYRU